MREIKFRGRDIEGKWLYGDLINSQINNTPTAFIFPADAPNSYDRYSVNPNTIGQFTGLRDKNGKDIYEGDILIICEYENQLQDIKHTEAECELFTLDEIKGKLLQKYKSVIHYEDCTLFASELEGCSIYLASLAGDMRQSYPIFEYEVIGNIHDNPELLNGKNE